MKQQRLIPNYYNQFSCIGSTCEDTCCAGWNITIDKQSFTNYRKITSGPLATDLQKSISRTRKSTSEMEYAKFILDTNNRCTLLAEDGLCKIHRDLGEEYLCHTCATYPRHTNIIDNRLEKSMVVSCPEAARLILLNESGIDFIIEEEEVSTLMHHEAATYFWDIRMFAIELLQTRTITVEERLIILGMFLEKLERIDKSLWEEQLPKLITQYNAIIHDYEQLQLIKSLPTNMPFQFNLARHLINSKTNISNQRYLDCLNDLLQGLQLNDHDNIERSIELYKTAETTYYRSFIENHEYILENYLVNYLFRKAFPNNTQQLFEQYTMIIIHFILVKIHLIGIASSHKKLTTDDALKCIQSFSKTYEHNAPFFINVLQLLKEYDYTTMAHMIALIKS